MNLAYLILGYLALYLVIWSHEVVHAVMYKRYGCKENPFVVHVPLHLLFSTPAPLDEKKAQSFGAKKLSHWYSSAPLARLNNQMTINILSNHIATSLLSLIEWWLENNMKPAPAEMGKVYKSLIIDSTVGAVSSLSVISK